MGKADQLLRSMGGIIAESASHRGAPAVMPTTPASSTLTTDRLAGVARSKAALDIPLAKIEADPDQPREDFDEDSLARLAGSVGSRGILQPIRVRWDEGRGAYVIIAGERRWRAAKMAGLATLPCVLDDRPATAGELLAMQMVENCLREDLKPVEQAKAFRALMSLNGWSGNQLAKELGVSQSGVVQTLALLELPEAVQLTVDKGDLSASSAYAIASLGDPVAQAEIAAQVIAEGLTRAETVEAVKRMAGRSKSKAAPKAKKITRRLLKTSNGVKLTLERSKGLDDALIVAALEDALAQIQARLNDGQAAA
jgi:ParB family transcriptional regulator, chromosome partitioning protein